MTILEQRRGRYEQIAALHGGDGDFEAFYDAVDAAADSLPDDVDSSVRTWFAALVEHTLESMGNPANAALDHLDDSATHPSALANYQYLTTAMTTAWVFAGASLKPLPASGDTAGREAVTIFLKQLADVATDTVAALLPVENATTADCPAGRVARELVDAGARGLTAGSTRADMGQLVASWLPIGYHRATAEQRDEAKLPIWILTSVAEAFADVAESGPQRHYSALAAALEETARHLPVRNRAADDRIDSATSRIYRACGQTMLAKHSSDDRARLRRMFGDFASKT